MKQRDAQSIPEDSILLLLHIFLPRFLGFTPNNIIIFADEQDLRTMSASGDTRSSQLLESMSLLTPSFVRLKTINEVEAYRYRKRQSIRVSKEVLKNLSGTTENASKNSYIAIWISAQKLNIDSYLEAASLAMIIGAVDENPGTKFSLHIQNGYIQLAKPGRSWVNTPEIEFEQFQQWERCGFWELENIEIFLNQHINDSSSQYYSEHVLRLCSQSSKQVQNLSRYYFLIRGANGRCQTIESVAHKSPEYRFTDSQPGIDISNSILDNSKVLALNFSYLLELGKIWDKILKDLFLVCNTWIDKKCNAKNSMVKSNICWNDCFAGFLNPNRLADTLRLFEAIENIHVRDALIGSLISNRDKTVKELLISGKVREILEKATINRFEINVLTEFLIFVSVITQTTLAPVIITAAYFQIIQGRLWVAKLIIDALGDKAELYNLARIMKATITLQTRWAG